MAGDYEAVDDYLKPSDFQERLPVIALIATVALTACAIAGTFLWLEFSSDLGFAELRAARPQVTKRVPPLRRGARSAEQGADSKQEEPDKSGKNVDRTPKAPAAAQARAAILHPHPDPKLVEKTDIGVLPIIGKDGRKPWRVYSRPFNILEKRPRIAIVMTGLGVSYNATEGVVGKLPGEVTLAFAPFSVKLKAWIDAARGAGHEVLINLPMEPKDFPRNDPGPFGLLTGLDEAQNLRRLEWILSRMTGYVGATNYLGTRFTGNKVAMQPVLREVWRRGLMFVDSMENTISVGPGIAKALKLPLAVNNRIIDRVVSGKAIDRELAEIEGIAKAQGIAVAFARPYPVTIRRLRRWIDGLGDKGLVLAPVSSVANKQQLR